MITAANWPLESRLTWKWPSFEGHFCLCIRLPRRRVGRVSAKIPYKLSGYAPRGHAAYLYGNSRPCHRHAGRGWLNPTTQYVNEMNAKVYLSCNAWTAGTCLGFALVSRLARWFEAHDRFHWPWLRAWGDSLANIEHILTGVGAPALLVAMLWFSWGLMRPRLQGAAWRWLRRVDAAVPWVMAVGFSALYVTHSYRWEHPNSSPSAVASGSGHHVLGTLANHFAYDCAGVAIFMVVTVLLFGGRFAQMAGELSNRSFKFNPVS